MVWAVNRLRPLVANLSFTIVTDCNALVYLSTHRTLNPQVIRWNDQLSEYDYKIIHRAGVKMAHVDALSRAPVSEPEVSVVATIASINNEADLVRMYQHCDAELAAKKKVLEKAASQWTKDERGRVEGMELREGILYRRFEGRLLYAVPRPMRKGLVVRYHDLKSHQGVERVVARLRRHYHFPRMKAYVRRHVRACIQCLMHKAKVGRQAGTLRPIPPGRRPFELIHMDHLGPFETSTRGNKYVFVIVDNLTKFVVIRAVKDTKTRSVLPHLEEFVCDYGAPARIVTDRGTCYTSEAFEDFCRRHGIKHTLNSPRHPQANGQVERWNAVLLPALRSSVGREDGRDWDMQLRRMQSDLNEMSHSSTGKSPFELLLGYLPQRNEGVLRQLTDPEHVYEEPRQLQEDARRRIVPRQEAMKERYDRTRMKNVDFEVGCLVYMTAPPRATGDSTKLQPKYRGPLVVVERLAGDTYRVCDLQAEKGGRRYATTAHASQLKLWSPESAESDDEDSNGSEDEELMQHTNSSAVEVSTGESHLSTDDGTNEREESLRIGSSEEGRPSDNRRPQRVRRPPRHLSVYETEIL